MTATASYRGRFAPSPTGPLHFGSLVAAAASYLEARVRGGEWLVRVEDLDPPREVPGATDDILSTLEALGFQWDGPVVFQSERSHHYAEALERLADADLVYACRCSRTEARAASRKAGLPESVYPGTCSTAGLGTAGEVAIRVRTDELDVTFEDRVQGRYTEAPGVATGDFVVRRRDSLTAYQLAVVVDDHLQGVTDIVRGCDLLDNTPRQIYLQRLLGYRTPDYLHVPVAVNAQGLKLSKQTGAAPIEPQRAGSELCAALSFLRQSPPAGLAESDAETVWSWAVENWSPDGLRGTKSVEIESN